MGLSSMKLGKYGKFITALVGVALESIATFGLEAPGWVTGTLIPLLIAVGVYQVPNKAA